MRIKIPIRAFCRPSSVAITMVLASFAAWLCPAFGALSKGFDTRQSLNATAFTLLGAWYLLIWLSFYLGQKLGPLLLLGYEVKSESGQLDSNSIYYAFTVLSVIGIAAAYYQVLGRLSIPEAIAYLSLGNANELKKTLYDDYHRGITSLRYVIIYSASLSLRRVMRYKRPSLPVVINALCLAAAAMMSSRLTLMATLLTTLFICNVRKTTLSIRVGRAGLIAGVIFLVLSALNYSRNAGYYQNRNESFWTAGCSEIITYLGAPFQVAVGSSKVLEVLAAGRPESYRSYVEVQPGLTTNSAFVHLHEEMGYVSWVYIAAMCTVMGLLFAVLRSLGTTAFLLPCGAILYGSAELWRLDLFREGIFLTWLAVGIGVPLLMLLSRKCQSILSVVSQMHNVAL